MWGLLRVSRSRPASVKKKSDFTDSLSVRAFVYRLPCFAYTAMDDLYSMTVAQLKERLKEKGLPVSGKKAELIARLREGEEESFVPDEKYEIECAECEANLRVPTDYSGRITCPKCMTKTQVTSPLPTDGKPNYRALFPEVPEGSSSYLERTNDYEFVTGPDGQTYAVKKSNFSWGDYFLGLFGTLAAYILLIFATPGLFDTLTDTTCGLCFVGIPSLIGGVGWSKGRPGVAVGALTAVVASPALFIVGCFTILLS